MEISLNHRTPTEKLLQLPPIACGVLLHAPCPCCIRQQVLKAIGGIDGMVATGIREMLRVRIRRVMRENKTGVRLSAATSRSNHARIPASSHIPTNANRSPPQSTT